MKKVTIYTACLFISSAILIFLFASAFDDRNGVLSVGLVIILLLSIVISLLVRMLKILKRYNELLKFNS
ncbi:hypothetical protein [Thalassobacillus sp. CUG 92003]|uniref:hypothetical protein n=1 Tax=Thalassobacillus sp. CUG 92003 TaxID=2736641 RepID=UPI0015E6C93A|nr:hypothetical protein [Thalassobacillus sp. CUG 92003]